MQWEGTEGAMRAQMGVNLDYPAGRSDTLKYIFRGDSSWKHAEVDGNWFPDAFVGTMGSLQAFLEGSTSVLPTRVEDGFETMRVVVAAYLSSRNGGIRPNEL